MVAARFGRGAMHRVMILLIDNYDSFVENLARYLRRLGQETVVVRNDAITASQVLAKEPAAIVLSPGPCTPAEAGCSLEVVQQAAGRIPILGVCLGHQTIGAAFGARILRSSVAMHGRASRILHEGRGVFEGLASPMTVGRYHSLIVDEAKLSPDVSVTARTPDGIVMALAHRAWPVYGVQFHPESILTEGGYTLLANFLRLARLTVAGPEPGIGDERPLEPVEAALPAGPVTF
jgi:anthranilate synthase/aminodeoxychorismate synthase-like glutamine amidotransferase